MYGEEYAEGDGNGEDSFEDLGIVDEGIVNSDTFSVDDGAFVPAADATPDGNPTGGTATDDVTENKNMTGDAENE